MSGRAFSAFPRAIPAFLIGWSIAILDLVLIQCGCWVERGLRAHSVKFTWSAGPLGDRTTLLPMALFVTVAAAIGCYRLSSLIHPYKQFGLVLGGTGMVITICAAAASVWQREMALIGAGGAMLAISCAIRPLWAPSLAKLAAGGSVRGRPVIVLGFADEIHDVTTASLLLGHGLAEVGRFALPSDAHLLQGALLEPLERVLEEARRSQARGFIVTASWNRCAAISASARLLRASSLPVFFLPLEKVAAGILVSRGSDLFDLQRAPIGKLGSVLKRLVDVTIASIVLITTLPLLITIAVAVRLDSPGPIIFRQIRSGLDRRPFTIFKFRSMRVVHDCDQLEQARRGDSRVTRVGRWLRRTSVDELPQLFNVLRGEMSLVGPRPHAIAHDKLFRTIAEEYNMRHSVKPGITGWAQVGGARGETTRPEHVQRRVDLDLWYIKNWSLLLDIKILIRTALDIAVHDAY